jgi:hypothetical protein
MTTFEYIEEHHFIASAKDSTDAAQTFSLPKRCCPLPLLEDMAVCCLRRIAENSSLTPSLLEQLAGHHSPYVREAVADNGNTPEDTLWLLARDECVEVRYAMAENHNLLRSILEALSSDENPYVAMRAQATLDRLAGGQLVIAGNFGERGGGRTVLALG